MSDFKAKMHQIRFRLGLHPRHLGELTGYCRRPSVGFRRPTSKGEGREEMEGSTPQCFAEMMPLQMLHNSRRISYAAAWLSCLKHIICHLEIKWSSKKTLDNDAYTPGVQIYLSPCVTLIFDLLSPKVDRFMPLGVGTHGPWGNRVRPLPGCPCVHQNQWIRFQNIVFTSLVTDERTDRQPQNIMRPPAMQSGPKKA